MAEESRRWAREARAHTLTVIVTPRVILREGIGALLQGTRYKVVASAATAAELSSGRCPRGQQTLAIVEIDLQNGNLDEVTESVRLLRSLLPDGKVVLVAETEGRIDPHRVLALSPDACIFNIGSPDALIKVLELIFLDQRAFVFAKSIATTAKEDVESTDPPRGLQSDEPHRLGINGQSLSPRESQVLACLAQGNSNKVIARLYNLSEATVKVHLKAILHKLKARNRTQAAIWAIEHGFRYHFPEHSGVLAKGALEGIVERRLEWIERRRQRLDCNGIITVQRSALRQRGAFSLTHSKAASGVALASGFALFVEPGLRCREYCPSPTTESIRIIDLVKQTPRNPPLPAALFDCPLLFGKPPDQSVAIQ